MRVMFCGCGRTIMENILMRVCNMRGLRMRDESRERGTRRRRIMERKVRGSAVDYQDCSVREIWGKCRVG